MEESNESIAVYMKAIWIWTARLQVPMHGTLYTDECYDLLLEPYEWPG